MVLESSLEPELILFDPDLLDFEDLLLPEPALLRLPILFPVGLL
jgi:hypothetical protein